MNLNINKKKLNIIINIVVSLVLLAAVLGVGVYIGYNHKPEVDKVVNVSNKTNQLDLSSADFGPFWKAWNILSKKSIYRDSVSDQD